MKYVAMILMAGSLSACGYGRGEYEVNRNAVAPGALAAGSSAKAINPVSGEFIGGSGTPMRSMGNPKYQHYDPYRLMRN
jgi:hypothetical protein